MGCDISALFDRLFPLWGVCDFPPQEALLRRGQATERAVQVAVAAFPYLLPEAQYAGRNIARYAVVRDYHTVCGARLAEACRTLGEQYPGASFAWYCDNSPLPEVALAEEAGLGRRGLHNLLITEEFGSWIFLGELTATITLPRNAHQTCVGAAVGCMECRRCIEACPTGALGAGGFDRNRCLSFLSQKKGGLTSEEEALLRRGGSAWGCDICQEVCPCNAGRTPVPLPEFLQDPQPRLQSGTSPGGRAFAWRGADVLTRNLRILAGSQGT